MTNEFEILKQRDESKEYDIEGHVSFSAIIKALKDSGYLIRGENIFAVYPTEGGIGYYAKLD